MRCTTFQVITNLSANLLIGAVRGSNLLIIKHLTNMVIGFKERFIKPILAKTKKHTIREDVHNRWKSGMKMHMATGVRTKKYNQFNEYTCKSIQEIKIIRTSDYLRETIVNIDGRKLTEPEVQQLAWNDGFENLVDFWMWFSDGFEGKIIHWTELRY